MNELADAIKANQAVLFLGAGATKGGGGASWDELAVLVSSHFGIPPQQSPQETFDEVCMYRDKRKDAYKLVQDRLSDVKAEDALKRLLSVPWLAVYTTNYDTAVEDFYKSEGILRPRTLCSTERAVQLGIPGEILVFKLMGCRTAKPDEKGEMILSSVDRKRHQREESQMYEHLDEFVSARVILAVGYSFSDNILMEAIHQIKSLRVQPKIEMYALFPPDDDSPLIKRIERLGVRVLRDNLESFSKNLQSAVHVASAEEKTVARFKGRTLSLSPRAIRDAIQAFDVVTENECQKSLPYEEFLRGRTSHAGAYEARLQWVREAIEKGRSKLDKWFSDRRTTHLVINYVGRPGSGRTVASHDLLHYCVSNYPSVGLRTPQRSPRLDGIAASQMVAHVLEKVGHSEIPFLSVLVDEHSSLSDVLGFVHEVEPAGTSVLVIRASENPISASATGKYVTVEFVDIELSDQISAGEVDSLSSYVISLPPEVRPARWTYDEIKHAAENDPSFIELMYRLVDPAKRSISDIVLDAYAEADDHAKDLVQYLLVPSSAGIGLPLTLLAKVQGISYPDLYALLDECRKLVRVDEDGIKMPYVSVFHRRVAEMLLAVPKVREEVPFVLGRTIGAANLANGSEHQLIADLLIGIPGAEAPVEKYLDNDEILHLLSGLRHRDASRLLLHHYGIRLRNARRYEESVDVLKEAMDTPENPLQPTERKEIVATTLAHVRWLLLKERNSEYDENDPQLQEIRQELRLSRAKTRWNPHSYGIEARIITDLASRREGTVKMDLLAEAIGILREGLTSSGGEDPHLIEQIEGTVSLLTEFSEKEADELQKTFGSGHGFYLLYERAKRMRSPGGTKDRLLSKAIASKVPCVPALREAIELELTMAPDPDYDKARIHSDAVFNYRASSPKAFSLNWTDHLQRIACLIGSGNGKSATEHIAEVRRSAPRNIAQPFPYFLRSRGSRKEFHGQIGEVSSLAVGSIVNHDVFGYKNPIFFNPSRGKSPAFFRQGDNVKFNLAIGVYGLAGWDVAPS